jgi:hypothetical protein
MLERSTSNFSCASAVIMAGIAVGNDIWNDVRKFLPVFQKLSWSKWAWIFK